MNRLKNGLLGGLLGAVFLPVFFVSVIGPPAFIVSLIGRYQPNELGLGLSLLVIFGWLGFLFGVLEATKK